MKNSKSKSEKGNKFHAKNQTKGDQIMAPEVKDVYLDKFVSFYQCGIQYKECRSSSIDIN